MRRRTVVIVALAAVLGIGVAAGLYWFEPWRLFTSTTVDELVGAGTVLREGSFVTHEHDTSGVARLVTYPDGRRVLELVDLATSDGPDLRVWLTDREVTDDWRVFDDGRWTELGPLKGNRGNQVYTVPDGLDLDAYRSVAIWCRRFAVSFGAAELR